MLPPREFDRFRQAMLSLAVKDLDEKYSKADLIRPCFLLFCEAGLNVYYVPFHYLNSNARVVLMGLTPGWRQMEEAFRAARKALSNGLEGERLFQHIQKTGSFSGPMRNNLVCMLDGIGLNAQLGIGSCFELFDTSSHLAHFTSAVNAPIFRNGKNYRGYGPSLFKVAELRKWLVENLAVELASVPKGIIVPLGKVADEVIQFLHKNTNNQIGLDRCLMNFPHPSGANGHRKSLYESGCERWAKQLAAWFALGSNTPRNGIVRQ
jgi:hypothetical protein